MPDNLPTEQLDSADDVSKARFEALQKKVAELRKTATQGSALLLGAIDKLKAVDTKNDDANNAFVLMRVSNLEKLVVVDGASLALSFSGLSAIRHGDSSVHLHYLISVAWSLFIGGIISALASNWLAVLSMRYKQRVRTFYTMQEPIRLLRGVVNHLKPNIAAGPEEEEAQQPGMQFSASWQRSEKASTLVAWTAQCCSIAGFVLLCIFFIRNLS